MSNTTKELMLVPRLQVCGRNLNEGFFNGFTKLFNTEGRMRRDDYWQYMLLVYPITFILYVVYLMMVSLGLLWTGLLMCTLIIPLILYYSATIRRLHDVGDNCMIFNIAFTCTALLVLLVIYDSYQAQKHLEMSLRHGHTLHDAYVPHHQSDTLNAIKIVLMIAAYIGNAYVLIKTLLDSEFGDNRYGKATKYVLLDQNENEEVDKEEDAQKNTEINSETSLSN